MDMKEAEKDDLEKELRDIYTPLSVAKKEIRRRWNDKELRKKVDDFLGVKIEDFFKEGPVACLGRNIASPTLEFNYFLELAKEISLRPLVIEHVKDKFVAKNSDKYHLAKLYFYDGDGKKRGSRVDAINAIDFNKFQGKKINSIHTSWGENFVDFHHRILKCQFPSHCKETVDISDILDLSRKGLSKCYDKYLAIFIYGGVLFENFLLSKDLEDFTHKIVVPSFTKLEKKFGVRPLIVPLSPIDDQDDLYWWCYPSSTREHVCKLMKNITLGGIDYKKISHRDFKKALVRLRPSKIIPGEVGIFAVRNLSKGTIIGDATLLNEELFFTRDDYEKIDKESKNVIRDFCIPTPNGFFAPKNINYLSIPWYINHSCGGNVGYDKKGNFVTIKNVKKGDELCYDYGLAVSYPGYRLDCECGSKNCRKVITGDDWKNVEYRKKNYRHMTPELREIIDETINKGKK